MTHPAPPLTGTTPAFHDGPPPATIPLPEDTAQEAGRRTPRPARRAPHRRTAPRTAAPHPRGEEPPPPERPPPRTAHPTDAHHPTRHPPHSPPSRPSPPPTTARPPTTTRSSPSRSTSRASPIRAGRWCCSSTAGRPPARSGTPPRSSSRRPGARWRRTTSGGTPGRPVVVVGHSGGGYAALAWAAGLSAGQGGSSAQRLAGLVLVSTASHGQDTPANEVRMMGSKLFSRALRTPWLGYRLLGGTHGPSASPSAREANRRLFASTLPGTQADCFASTREMDQRAGLARITAPTAVITGTEDRIVKPSFSQELVSALPHAELHRIPGTGHMVPLETPLHIAQHVHLLVTAGR
ncbi:alpha/beta fold hydrolase [Kitasatospora sp. NPDC091335]|uniref:alpha/beta fold hydrolase n=1 Tax=Kitasatospora sp. NPDC091335 TaxID=3364085 RepID=UPI00381FCA0F